MRTKQVDPRKNPKKQYRSTYSQATMLAAYAEVKKGMLVATAARKYGIPVQTLRDRVIGHINPETCHSGPDTILSKSEELTLVEHAESMSQFGFGISNGQMQELGGELAYYLGKRPTPSSLSSRWLYAFLKRWDDRISPLKSRSLEFSKINGVTPDSVKCYYKNLLDILMQYDLIDKPQFIYNIDETGLETIHQPPKAKDPLGSATQTASSPKSTTVTMIGCANASGNSVPPFFVFKGKRWNSNFMTGATSGVKGVLSESGRSNCKIFKQYLEEHFLPFARASASPSQPVLLLLDGHTSLVSIYLTDWAKTQNIILLVLPAYSRHFLQPLDVGVHGPFKAFYHSECQSMKANNGQVVTKFQICALACKAYQKAMNPVSIQSAFRKTGIHPFREMVVAGDELYPAEGFPGETSLENVINEVNKVTVGHTPIDLREKLKDCLKNLGKEAQELYLDKSVPELSQAPSPLHFYRHFVAPNKPVVINNALNHWKAIQQWNNSYLREKIGEQDVTVAVTPNGYADAVTAGKFVMPEQRVIKLSQFLDVLESPEEFNGILYIQKQNSNLTDEFSAIMEDVEPDITWGSEAFGKKPDAVNFWMGDERAVTSMHRDHYENLYCVVKGWKKFLLIPPTDLPCVPYEKYQAAVFKEAEDGQFMIEDDQETGQVPWVAIDPLKPDLEKYPEFSQAHPVEVTVHAGQMLYLPSLWFHHVRQSHGCIAVNYWYDMDFDIKYNYYKCIESLVDMAHV